MVQGILEHFTENKRLIPHHQFGFRRNRSAIDCATVLATDVTAGFLKNKGTAALALDLKGAFTALLPTKILEELRECKIPARLYNFLAHMIIDRQLIFGDVNCSPTPCRTGVPQGRVLSPILFNLSLRKIQQYLPADVSLNS